MIDPNATGRIKGSCFEALAAQYLCQRGATVIAKNFTARRGELDLVVTLNGELIFVEVRFRLHAKYGDPLESITPHKQRRLHRAAEAFLQRYPQWQGQPCRFDVIAISQTSSDMKETPKPINPHASVKHASPQQYHIEWVCNAFQVSAW